MTSDNNNIDDNNNDHTSASQSTTSISSSSNATTNNNDKDTDTPTDIVEEKTTTIPTDEDVTDASTTLEQAIDDNDFVDVDIVDHVQEQEKEQEHIVEDHQTNGRDVTVDTVTNVVDEGSDQIKDVVKDDDVDDDFGDFGDNNNGEDDDEDGFGDFDAHLNAKEMLNQHQCFTKFTSSSTSGHIPSLSTYCDRSLAGHDPADVSTPFKLKASVIHGCFSESLLQKSKQSHVSTTTSTLLNGIDLAPPPSPSSSSSTSSTTSSFTDLSDCLDSNAAPQRILMHIGDNIDIKLLLGVDNQRGTLLANQLNDVISKMPDISVIYNTLRGQPTYPKTPTPPFKLR
ncbi:hypothetical protein SAMD00019534_051360 [Acytostelium subglobosum LB1]|uniref:hypothetical protein n=1 Tax=Acytostelium subglobosum LB1 TaxID=1410327 RepID=UPI00064485B2|nr:hypothetical protein SAMD00019534_051360 [Acytostelium subglobosum LB1]GAM21961.1 hypothetical protein SAMD00019534_051360 [Acytostelium subglobosum LB1]|eukprot:XP_012755061.1 hypothetical protein SAMD00019534_051360 [Acytostelium subglobosum LB1]